MNSKPNGCIGAPHNLIRFESVPKKQWKFEVFSDEMMIFENDQLLGKPKKIVREKTFFKTKLSVVKKFSGISHNPSKSIESD